MAKYPPPPKALYFEVWPDGIGRQDTVHVEQTGYGVDLRTGARSRIYVYVPAPTPAKKRRKR